MLYFLMHVQVLAVPTDDPTTKGVELEDTPTSSGSRISLLIILVVSAVILILIVTGLAFIFFSSRNSG